MAKEYRQMLIDEETHREISGAKRLLETASGRRVSSREAIGEFLGRRMRFLVLDRHVRAYINAFVGEAALDRRVLGLMLFGSVARNSFGDYSDIDVMVVVEGKALGSLDAVEAMIEGAEPFRKPLVAGGLHLRIRPFMVSRDELKRFRPIYINILEDGVILFERGEIMFDFLNDIRQSVDYSKLVVGGSAAIRWKMRE
jgi:predicted nucleotidyltransferase